MKIDQPYMFVVCILSVWLVGQIHSISGISEYYSTSEQLKSFPEATIPHGTTSIYIHDSQIRRVTSVPSYPNLGVFAITDNLLTEVPNLRNVCSRLTRLDLSWNRITTVNVDVIDCMTSLTDLNLTGNRLRACAFTTAMKRGPRHTLLLLILNDNMINAFPDVSYFEKLRYLKVSGNPIVEVKADSMKGLNHLQEVNISGTLITTVPDMCRMPVTVVDMQNIPLVCDIRMAWLKFEVSMDGLTTMLDAEPCRDDVSSRPLSTLQLRDFKWNDGKVYINI